MLNRNAPLGWHLVARSPVTDGGLDNAQGFGERGDAAGFLYSLVDGFHGANNHASCCSLSTHIVLDDQHKS